MLRYTLTNASGCTTYVDRGTIVNPLPATPRINYAIGTVPPEAGGGICNGRTFTLVGSPTGGVWSTTTPTTVSINPTTGVTNTIGLGSGNVTYTVTNSFGCNK